MLGLTSLAQDTEVSKKSTVFYIRSFEFTAEEFGEVLGSVLGESYSMNDRIFPWLEQIEELEKQKKRPEETIWTVRYCGKTNKGPWTRHKQDLTQSTKAKSWFLTFLETTRRDHPEIALEPTIDMVALATAAEEFDPTVLNLREQILIALCGDGVLNMQVGGEDILTRFTQRDEEVFLHLHTKTRSLMNDLDDCPDKMARGLDIYIQNVRQYVNDNPASTGTDRREFTPALEACLLRQATPTVLSIGCALFTTMATDIGQDDHDDSEFYHSGRRSAEVVNACFDQIEHWEKPDGSPFKRGATKAMSNDGYLPFVDLFPWFRKDDHDFGNAGQLLLSYLNATSPLIVLTYGQLPSYFAMNGFQSLEAKWFYDVQRTANVKGGSDYFIRELGRPQICKIGESDDNVVIIQSYHPGYLAQAGLPAEKATRLFFMIHQVVWFSMGVALHALRDKNRQWNRNDLSFEVVEKVNEVLEPSHGFGKTFAAVVKETIEVTKAFSQGRSARREIRSRDKPKAKSTRACSPKKDIRKERKVRRKQQISAAARIPTDTAIGPYSLTIRATNLANDQAPRNDKQRFLLSWTETNSATNEQDHFTVGPISLPGKVYSAQTATIARNVFYTSEGLDIRDRAGNSQGEVKPLVTGKAKNVTLPISFIVLQSNIDDKGDQKFLEHWEDVTGIDIEDYLRDGATFGTSNTNPLGGSLPESFFQKTPNRSMLIPAVQHLHQGTLASYTALMNTHLVPIQTADLLWLFYEFFKDLCGSGASTSFDCGSGSETASSVFLSIAQFCRLPRYKNHPHIRTLLALVHLPETGIAERALAVNVVALAVEVLAKYTKGKKSMVIMHNNTKHTPAHAYYTINGTSEINSDKVAPYKEPTEEGGIEILEERIESDDESDSAVNLGKRTRADSSGSEESDAVTKPGKLSRLSRMSRRATQGGGVGQALEMDDEDDEMLLEAEE